MDRSVDMTNAEIIQFIVGLFALLGIVWQVSQVKSAIDKAIDAVKDEAFTRHSLLEKRLDVHLENYINRQEMVNLVTSQLDEKINHKFGRCFASIRDMEKFLQKYHSETFRVREYFNDDSGQL